MGSEGRREWGSALFSVTRSARLHGKQSGSSFIIWFPRSAGGARSKLSGHKVGVTETGEGRGIRRAGAANDGA